ncbi:xylose isomerase [Klebsiella michiganensis]|uniref:Xylose isomerase n=1 Tax=Klebsiella michiganensis TaxID=1134687 RepID=A0A7H4PFM8_9ENTR|nr:xylose isomerase [Klebsiella michiganensis]
MKEYANNFAQMVDVLAEKTAAERRQAGCGVRQTALRTRVTVAGAATNPDPEVFSWAATQVVTAMDATHKLGRGKLRPVGGREGYETLLNTDLRQEREQIGRFMQLVVEHKHKNRLPRARC